MVWDRNLEGIKGRSVPDQTVGDTAVEVVGVTHHVHPSSDRRAICRENAMNRTGSRPDIREDEPDARSCTGPV